MLRAARRLLAVKRSAQCVGACVLSKMRVAFSTRVAKVDISFAEWYLYLEATCDC